MLVVVNPFATTMSDRLKHLVVYALQARYDVTAVETTGRGHAAELARGAAADGFDVVVAFGGDGTVNEAANGLAQTATPLAVLPGGATNVYCRMLGAPIDVVDATQRLLDAAEDWCERRVDLGRIGERWFLFAAGMGLDASVVERVDRHPRLKARWGPWFYAQAAVSTFLADYVRQPPQLDVRADGERLEGVSAFLQVADTYTYFGTRPVRLAAGPTLDSGDLALLVLARATPRDVPSVTIRALSGAAAVARHRAVTARTGLREVSITSRDGRPVPIQVDGDHITDAAAATVALVPGALRVVA